MMPIDHASDAVPKSAREVVFRSRLGASARRVFAWHQSPEALRELIPPWEPVSVETPPPNLRDGAVAVLRVGVWPLRLRWVAEHRGFRDDGDAGGEFTDVQVRGPFAYWHHRHIVQPAETADACVLEDRVTYALPLGVLADVAAGWFVRRKLARMFRFRHEATARAVGAVGSGGSGGAGGAGGAAPPGVVA